MGTRYTVERELARGGAARVFLAHDPSGTTVALKVLRPELAVTVTADRFLREINMLSQFDHPHIAKLLDSGESDYLVYYVMPFVNGPTLREHLNKVRQATTSDSLRIATDLLDALSYAHERGIIHRDVKPENIVLSRQGPVLVDFGIARAIAASGLDRLTRSGFAVGTSTYMSPEQAMGEVDIDHRTDIYSLGCVLFECLAGRPPFTGKNDDLVLRLHIDGRAPSLGKTRKGLSKDLVTAVDRALERDRSKRWASAAEMREALARIDQ